jgi:hypothetical protein
MLIFEQIELFLDGSYDKDERRSFIFKTRSICNFLERALAEKKFTAPLSRVNIFCTRSEEEVCVKRLKNENFLEVYILFDIPNILNLDGVKLQEQMKKIIGEGLQIASTFMDVPYEFCMETLQKFIDGGCVNRWVHTAKKWNRNELESKVIGALTTSKFSLIQQVYIGGTLECETKIAETKPRELVFNSLLGRLSKSADEKIYYKVGPDILTCFDVRSKQFVEPKK